MSELQRQASIVPMGVLFAHCIHELPEDFDERMSPAILILSTRLKEHKDK